MYNKMFITNGKIIKRILTSVKTGEMTVDRLADLLSWSGAYGKTTRGTTDKDGKKQNETDVQFNKWNGNYQFG